MAYLELNTKALRHNYDYLQGRMDRYGKSWGVVTKLLCGVRPYLQEVLRLEPDYVCDSRLSNLKAIKHLAPGTRTAYIKPPPKRSIPSLLDCADISFNTQRDTIEAINTEAGRRGITHKVVIMIEMGDLREGVMREEFLDFYRAVFRLPHVEVIGIGTNLNCVNGVMPSLDKLIQLSLYEQLIEASFERRIDWVSAGTSITLPLLSKNQVPVGVNHFRIGETLFFGNNLITGKPISEMRQDVFRLQAEVIEITEKPTVASGMAGVNVAGERPSFDVEDMGRTSHRAILDIGLLDIDPRYLQPENESFEFGGASSDMIMVDVGAEGPDIQVGDLIPFRPDYLGTLTLMNSRYVEKRIRENRA